VRRLASIVLVVAAAAGAATVAYAAQSPNALRASILAAARAQHSVHWSAKDVVGNVLVTSGADVTADAGIQRVHFQLGTQKSRVEIVVINDTAYVQGDATGLELNLGLTKAQATQYAGQWISIPKGDKLYATTSEGDTVGSLVDAITPHGRLSSIATKVHGARVIGVRGISGTGKKKTAEVLVTRATGKRLPIESDSFTPGTGYADHTTFSKWNEPVHVQAPASSTPIATVRGA
jgi:hypothetical protein